MTYVLAFPLTLIAIFAAIVFVVALLLLIAIEAIKDARSSFRKLAKRRPVIEFGPTWKEKWVLYAAIIAAGFMAALIWGTR